MRHSSYLLLLLPFALHAQTPVLQWAHVLNNITTTGDYARVSDVTVAPDGSVYIRGQSNGTHNLVGDQYTGKYYVARYDEAGNSIWAAPCGNAVIAANGNNGVYAAGVFTGTLQLGGTILNAADEDAFVAKYDTSGNVLWAQQMGGTGSEIVFSVTVDGLGRVHVGGSFQTSATFGSTTLTATHANTGFHAVLTANGAFDWAVRAGGLDGINPYAYIGNALACDALGGSVMAGTFEGSASFGSVIETALQQDDAYLARFDANGACTWVQRLAGDGNFIADVAFTPSGNIYLYGKYRGSSATFGGTTLPYSTNGQVYLALCDAGGSPQWAVPTAGHPLSSNPRSIAVDPGGHAFISGFRANGNTTFGSIALTGAAGTFLAEYDETGAVQQAQRMNNTFLDGYAMSPQGAHFIVGEYGPATWFDQTDTTAYTSPSGFLVSYQGYLTRYDASLNLDLFRANGLHDWAFDGGASIVDDSGNTYLFGQFSSSVMACEDTLYAMLGMYDLLLAKYDANGGCAWSRTIRSIEGSSLFAGASSAGLARAPNGDLVLTGQFRGTLHFGNTSISAVGDKDIFLARFDGSGNLLWALREGGSYAEEPGDVLIDANGDIVLCGQFTGNSTIGGQALSSQGQSDGFIAKYTSTGTPLWTEVFGGAGFDHPVAMTHDDSSNVFVSARFSTSCAFGTQVVNGTSTADFAIARYSAAGVAQWALGSSGTDYNAPADIAIGVDGKLYFAGRHGGALSFAGASLSGQAGTLVPHLGCIDASGSLVWLKEFATGGQAGASGLALRPNGDIVLCGSYDGSIDIDGQVLTSPGGNCLYLASFLPTGDLLWAHAATADEPLATVNARVSADADHIHLGGTFGGLTLTPGTSMSLLLAPPDPSTAITVYNATDIFLAKYTAAQSVGLPALSDDDAPILSPNPVMDQLVVQGSGLSDPRSTITLRDMTGREVRAPWTRQTDRVIVDASELPAGAYSVTIAASAGQRTAHFIKH